MDGPLITESDVLQLSAEIAAMQARLVQLNAEIAAFVASITAQVTQFASDEAGYRAFWLAQENALVANYLQQITSIVDAYETMLVKHLNAYSPDATHNGATDPDESFSQSQAPFRPYLTSYLAPTCPARANGPTLFDQYPWLGNPLYRGTIYTDALAGVVGFAAIQLQAPGIKSGQVTTINIPVVTA